MKLDGFGIFVKDMPTMVRFYRDVLGFEIKEEENTTRRIQLASPNLRSFFVNDFIWSEEI